MTNPNDAVGTPAAYDGRSSVKSFNDTTGAFTRGIISGWECSPKSGMIVQIGGDGTNRDIAVAEDNAGNRTTIDNISESPIDITISGAPATGNRIDLIVAYVDSNPQGDGSTPDNPDAVGLITVSGTVSSTPTEPDDTAIRTAITSDGATGASAYYVVLASIYVGTGITTIGSGAIMQGTASQVGIADGQITTTELADNSVTNAKIASNAVDTANVANGAITNAKMTKDANFANEVLIGRQGSEYIYKRIIKTTAGSAINTYATVATFSTTNLNYVVSLHGAVKGSGATEYYPVPSRFTDHPFVYASNGNIYENHSQAAYNSKDLYLELVVSRSA